MSTDLQLSRHELCEAIEREHKAAQRHYNKACEHAIKCGEYLLQAKSKAFRGDWLAFIERNFTFSTRTAQLYMRIARNPQRVAHLNSLREAQRVLAAPKPKAVDAANDPSPATSTPRPEGGENVEVLPPEATSTTEPRPLSARRRQTPYEFRRDRFFDVVLSGLKIKVETALEGLLPQLTPDDADQATKQIDEIGTNLRRLRCQIENQHPKAAAIAAGAGLGGRRARRGGRRRPAGHSGDV